MTDNEALLGGTTAAWLPPANVATNNHNTQRKCHQFWYNEDSIENENDCAPPFKIESNRSHRLSTLPTT